MYELRRDKVRHIRFMFCYRWVAASTLPTTTEEARDCCKMDSAESDESYALISAEYTQTPELITALRYP